MWFPIAFRLDFVDLRVEVPDVDTGVDACSREEGGFRDVEAAGERAGNGG